MVNFTECENAVTFRVRVVPRASKSEIVASGRRLNCADRTPPIDPPPGGNHECELIAKRRHRKGESHETVGRDRNETYWRVGVKPDTQLLTAG